MKITITALLITTLTISASLTIKSIKKEDLSFENLIKPDNDEDLNLDHKTPKIDRHELFGELKRGHRNKKDIMVVFYHPMCPHCHEFLPKFEKVLQGLYKKEKPQLTFYRGDCGINPHYIAAFGIKYFPFLVYFHNGIPLESMPPPFTTEEVLTKKWILDSRKKFKDYTVPKALLQGTKMKSEDDFFKKFMKVLKDQLFRKLKLVLHNPSNPSEILGRPNPKQLLDNLKNKKKMRIGKKLKKVKLSSDDDDDDDDTIF